MPTPPTAVIPPTVRTATMGDVRERDRYRTATGWCTALADATATGPGRVKIRHKTAAGLEFTREYPAGRATTIQIADREEGAR